MSVITTPQLRSLYSKAKRTDLPESYSTEFFTYILGIYFSDRAVWNIAPEVPRTDDPKERKRVDLAVKFFEHETYNTKVLCFVEAKRASAAPGYLIEGEEQMFTYYNRHCDSKKVPYVYIMMTKGAMARFLIYHRDEDQFRGIFEADDPTSGPNPDQFHDPDTDAGGSYWDAALRTMKTNPNAVPVNQAHEKQHYIGKTQLPKGIIRSKEDPSCLVATVGKRQLKIVPAKYFCWQRSYFLWDGESLVSIEKDYLPHETNISFPEENLRRRITARGWEEVLK